MQQVQVHPKDTLEARLEVSRTTEPVGKLQETSPDGFMVFSPSGFMVFSPSGFMVF